MAQKAAKQTARRNTTVLNRIHLITLCVHGLFILLRFLIFRSSATRKTFLLYVLLSAPALIIEFWLEKIGRPSYGTTGADLKRSGEDLEAKGLTEFMWDVLYWTLGCTALAALFGDIAWWLFAVVPLYSAYLAYTTFGGLRQGMSGLAGAAQDASDPSRGASNRQKKMEKRGGQRVQYR